MHYTLGILIFILGILIGAKIRNLTFFGHSILLSNTVFVGDLLGEGGKDDIQINLNPIVKEILETMRYYPETCEVSSLSEFQVGPYIVRLAYEGSRFYKISKGKLGSYSWDQTEIFDSDSSELKWYEKEMIVAQCNALHQYNRTLTTTVPLLDPVAIEKIMIDNQLKN